MTEHIEVTGVATFGGTTNITGPTAIGPGATVNITGSLARPRQKHKQDREDADIGIITVISAETSAVRQMLNLRTEQVGGLNFDVGTIDARGRLVTIAATRALAQGQESTMVAFNHLRECFDPAIVILTGIAGGIHPDARLGDVVVATRVIYYDLRKETPAGTLHRGQERQAPAIIGHAVNLFFTDHGEPASLPTEGPENARSIVRVLTGPIGSGNAVIADRDSRILKYLAQFNDKILAVDMEAGGLSHAHHEGLVTSARPLGWLVVRGISDDASVDKNDEHHHLAARNAAFVLRELIPYLPVGLTGTRGR